MNNATTLSTLLASMLVLSACPKHEYRNEPNFSQQAYEQIVQNKELLPGESIMVSRIQNEGTVYEVLFVYVAGVSDQGNKFISVDMSSSPYFNIDGATNRRCRLLDIGLDQTLEISSCEEEIVDLQGKKDNPSREFGQELSVGNFNTSLSYLLR